METSVQAGVAPQGEAGGQLPPKVSKKEKNKIWGIFMH